MKKGIYGKYRVEKVEGATDREAVYFVLRLDTDQHARSAVLHYAQLMIEENTSLAADIFYLIANILKGE